MTTKFSIFSTLTNTLICDKTASYIVLMAHSPLLIFFMVNGKHIARVMLAKNEVLFNYFFIAIMHNKPETKSIKAILHFPKVFFFAFLFSKTCICIYFKVLLILCMYILWIMHNGKWVCYTPAFKKEHVPCTNVHF